MSSSFSSSLSSATNNCEIIDIETELHKWKKIVNESEADTKPIAQQLYTDYQLIPGVFHKAVKTSTAVQELSNDVNMMNEIDGLLKANKLTFCALVVPRLKTSSSRLKSRSIAWQLLLLIHNKNNETDVTPQLVQWSKILYSQTIGRISNALNTYLYAKEQERLTQISITQVHQSEHKYCLLKKRPISNEVKNPQAMPVIPSFLHEVEPFIKYLEKNEELPDDETKQMEFQRGVIYSDARLDLCKQILHPVSMNALMNALTKNTKVQHFLLGNNIIGAEGLDHIIQFIRNTPNYSIQTFYLAGNRIDGEGFNKLVDALVERFANNNNNNNNNNTRLLVVNTHSTNAIWLKRNPLHMNPIHRNLGFTTLLHHYPVLRVLDLDNTGLLDDGTLALFESLQSSSLDTLRHLYLNGNGISHTGAKAIGRYFSACHEQRKQGLRSLFLSVNRIGDEGFAAIGDGLIHNRHLKRLIVSSNQIECKGVQLFTQSLASNPHNTLQVLDLGIYASGGDLQELPNRIQNEGVSYISDFLKTAACNVRILSVVHNGLTADGINTFMQSIVDTSDHHDLIHVEITERHVSRNQTLWKNVQQTLQANIKRLFGEDKNQKWLYQARCFHFMRNISKTQYIESVYRTRDFARPMRKHIQKRWTKQHHEEEIQRRVMIDKQLMESCQPQMKKYPIAFGTYQLRSDTCYESVLHALRTGYRMIDTSPTYKNQKEIGRAIAKAIEEQIITSRQDIILITKIPNTIQKKKNTESFLQSIQQSCTELGTSYIDVILLHRFINPDVTLAAWHSLIELQKKQNCKQIREIGVCNFEVEQLQFIINQTSIKPIVNQIELTPFYTREILQQFCKEKDILIQTHSPLTKGYKLNNTTNGITAECLLQWPLSKNMITVVRSSQPEHIEANYKVIQSIPSLKQCEITKLLCNEMFLTHPQYP